LNNTTSEGACGRFSELLKLRPKQVAFVSLNFSSSHLFRLTREQRFRQELFINGTHKISHILISFRTLAFTESEVHVAHFSDFDVVEGHVAQYNGPLHDRKDRVH
jgi:hypothetical protein